MKIDRRKKYQEFKSQHGETIKVWKHSQEEFSINNQNKIPFWKAQILLNYLSLNLIKP